jgi:hypothetical protein
LCKLCELTGEKIAIVEGAFETRMTRKGTKDTKGEVSRLSG